MNNNDNEIKFIKGRSNDSDAIEGLFKKGRYYDAFYKLKRLDKNEQIKFLPLMAEAYARLKKSDYEANELLKLLINSDGMLSGDGLDKRVIALRLSEYYSYKGEKLQRLSFSYGSESNNKPNRKQTSQKQKTGNLIKFVQKASSVNTENNVNENLPNCKIYKKTSVARDFGEYICERATQLAISGKYDEAIQALNKVGKNSPSYYDARNVLIAVYIDSGKVYEASNVAIELLKERPNEFIVLFAINTALNISVNEERILDELRKIEGKTEAQCSVLRANAFGKRGEFDRAIEILDSLDDTEQYIIDVLRVKAICYAGLKDRENEEKTLKQIITIYPKDVKARCVLHKIQKGEHVGAELLGQDDIIDCLMNEFKEFYENRLEQLEEQNFSIEELMYFYELCLRFGSAEVIENCTDKYLKCKDCIEVICDALIDLNLDDFKKLVIVERMVLSKIDGEYFSLINGMMKKLNLESLRFLISQFKETLTESFADLKDEYEPLNNVINNAFSKAFALSLMFDLDGAEVTNKVGALILYALLHRGGEMVEIVNVLYSAKNLACSACILVNPQLAKNSKLKKYLGLKNAEIDEIIKILQKTGFRN